MIIRFLKDNPWVVGLIATAILFLNIFIQNNKSHSVENQFYAYGELDKHGEIFDSLERLNSTRYFESRGKIKSPQNLNLELLGTIIGNPSLAFILRLDSGEYGLYKLNEVVAGAQIVSIASGRVTLEKDGLRQELLLKHDTADTGQARSFVIHAVSPNEMIVSRSGVINQMDKAKELLAKVKILPIPDTATDRLKGFCIDNVPLGSIIDKAGIKSKDIIYSVAGQRLESTQDAWRVFASLQRQSHIVVDLLRDGKPITLSYELRD